MLKMATAFTTCLFCSCFFLDRWNLVSMQRGNYPKPSLRITSGSVTVRGGNLTMRCTAPARYTDMTFALYRDVYSVPAQDPSGTDGVFHFTDVNPGDAGSYRCFYYTKGDPSTRITSHPSDTVEVTLRDAYPKPSVTLNPGSMIRRGGTLTIKCTSEYPNMRFFLFKDGTPGPKEDPPGNEAVFVISEVQRSDEGSYECRYHPRSGAAVWSDASASFRIRDLENQQDTSTATTPGNDEQMPSGEPTPSSMMTTTYIAIGCAVLLVVILVVALILYIKCKPKKAKGDIQKRNLPLNEQKNAEALETTYATVTKVKASNHTIAPEVKRQTEDRDDEGLTYATINKDALKTKKKNSSSPFQEPEPTLYAAVNIH